MRLRQSYSSSYSLILLDETLSYLNSKLKNQKEKSVKSNALSVVDAVNMSLMWSSLISIVSGWVLGPRSLEFSLMKC